MSEIFVFEERASKKSQHFHLFKGYFVMGGSVDMNVDEF